MEGELPRDVKRQLEKLEEAVGAFEEALRPLLGISPQELEELEPLDAAQIQLGLAQSVNELFKLYLRAAGTDPSDHPVKHEAERLQQYSLRVAKAVNARDLANSRRSLAVDIGAANRFIEHAIPELTDDQKQRLRQAGLEAQQEAKEAAQDGRKGKKRGKRDTEVATPSSKKKAQAKGADEFLEGILAATPSPAAKGDSAVAPSTGKKKKGKKKA